MTINEYIHQQRIARGWSLNDLAERAGISKGYLHNLENNPTDPAPDLTTKYVAALSTLMNFGTSTELAAFELSFAIAENEDKQIAVCEAVIARYARAFWEGR